MDKYLLFVDILGFSELVAKGSDLVEDLYTVLDRLNVHRHPNFRTIVFSDTVLVYNTDDPSSEDDHRYLTMYQCEFAQDLLYRLAGTGIYFRAVLRRGGFRFRKLDHLDSYFGTALIEAYRDEKSINCTGLFLHESCFKYNKIFPTLRFTDELHFVFLNQQFDYLKAFAPLPVGDGKTVIAAAGLEYDLVRDVILLKDIHDRMRNHPNPSVRAKFLCTWDMYLQRYGTMLDHLVANDFRLSSVAADIDWSDALDGARKNLAWSGFEVDLPDL